MSDLFQSLSPAHLVPAGHYGVAGATGVTAQVVTNLAAATLVARKGKTAALIAAATASGLPLVDAPKASVGAGLEAIGTGPGKWLVLAEGSDGAALRRRLEELAAGLGAVTDQSDANLVLDISGPKAREALVKGVAVDLDPRAFQPGDAATTPVSHVGVTFWQRDASPSYRFAVGNTFAPAFLRWLAASAAEYGFALEGTDRG